MDKKAFDAYARSFGLKRKATLESAKPNLKYLSLNSRVISVKNDSPESSIKSVKERLEAQRLENIKANDEAFDKAQSSMKERPFSVIDIPDVMEHKLCWPKSAEVMRKWFSLSGRAMTKDEKEGRRLYLASHTDTTMFSWSWLESFERVQKAKEVLLSGEVLWSENAQKEIRRLAKAAEYELANPIIDNSALEITELHANWQFQYSKVGYELGAVDDLYGSLGNFALYAAVQKAYRYEEGGQCYLRVTEIAIYMRDTFEFIGVQYLGHWDHEGMAITIMGGVFNKLEWKWRLPAWNPDLGVVEAFGNQEFREFREACGKGGDLLLFSDIITVDVDEIIRIDL
ncbi:DUF6402 family protein [Vibrio sp. TBV020]|uniref:DUF6402 family protein n=1 Tax=Vibrio sp. TBV020 TaxID=3137398 RepID=UPI0038CDA557